MSGTIKIRTDHKAGVTTVRALIRHPMTLPERDELGDITTPAHFIERVVCELNGTVVLTAHWGTGISKNPYIAFAVRGSKPGDRVKLSWTDNEGASDALEAVVSAAPSE